LDLAATKSAIPRCTTSSRSRSPAWAKSNSSSVLTAGKPARRIRALAPCASRAATSRPSTAARYSSWLQPCSRAASARRSKLSRIAGARNARLRKASREAALIVDPADCVEDVAVVAVPAVASGPEGDVEVPVDSRVTTSPAQPRQG
jgi:hypothetical protein